MAIPSHVPVIIFSGLKSESVEKPYSLVMLMDMLEEMLAQAQLSTGQ